VTRFTTPFGFHTTAAEVVAGIDLTGKKAIVTGGAGGIGAETARALAAAGASVTLAVRRTDAACSSGRVNAASGLPRIKASARSGEFRLVTTHFFARVSSL
jgi:NAD(P)-dependent dehydrogenase (short-subunit alcohol dehydrogenase family)